MVWGLRRRRGQPRVAAARAAPAGDSRPAGERWLRRSIAAVALLLLATGIGGSAADDGGHRTGAGRPAGTPLSTGTEPGPNGTPEPTPPAPVLADDPDSGPAPTATGIGRALAGPLSDQRLGGRVFGQVVDVATGAVLFDRGAGTPATPASTAKLTTAIAVLSVRRADDRIATRVVAGRVPGEVVLVGGGDPTLSAARPGAPTAYAGAARLSDLAAAIRRASRARVTRVLVDGSRYTGGRLAPGWNPLDVPGGYVAPITAVMTDGGRADPRLRARAAEPDLVAGRALAALLGIPAPAVARGPAPAGAAVLGEVRSAPVSRLVEQMLLASDNVLAEALARQVAIAEGLPASFPGAADAVRRVLGRIGVATAGARLVDGSGLSSLDRLTPAVLVAGLRVALSADHPALHALVPALPVGGYDGTLDNRYVRGPAAVAAGSVRAKTGTLDGVSTLAGVVSDASGRLLAFAFLADRVSIGATLPAEAALDLAAATLARCGCR